MHFAGAMGLVEEVGKMKPQGFYRDKGPMTPMSRDEDSSEGNSSSKGSGKSKGLPDIGQHATIELGAML